MEEETGIMPAAETEKMGRIQMRVQTVPLGRVNERGMATSLQVVQTWEVGTFFLYPSGTLQRILELFWTSCPHFRKA